MSEVLAADRGLPPIPPSVKGARARKVARYAGLVFAALIVLFPIYSAIAVAVQPASALINAKGLSVLFP